MEKKKIILLTFLVLSCCILEGCSFQTVEQESETQEARQEVNQYIITAKQFDTVKVCEALLPDFNGEIPPAGENGTTFIETGSSGVMTGKGLLNYQQNDSASGIADLFFFYIFQNTAGIQADLEKAAEEEALSDSVKRVNAVLEEILCPAEDEELRLTRTIKMNREQLQELERTLMKTDGSIECVSQWEAEEYQGLEYEIVKAGIPLMGLNEPDQLYYTDVFGAQAVYIQALLGDGQLIYLAVRGIVDAGEGEKVYLLSWQEAAEIAKAVNDLVVTDENKEIGNQDDLPHLPVSDLPEYRHGKQTIKLEYVPVPDWKASRPEPAELVPYWCVMKGSGESREAMRINAVTGGDLAYGE